ncbi:MAG: Regulatory protein luxR family [Actinotalea sp.]|nr:Regulatory protein luxR family [Actinotalea sp.]
MGIPGVGKIHPGDHFCALFSGRDERDRLLVPFMQEGLRHGDHCVCLIDDLEPASMRRRAYGPAGPGDTRRAGHLGVYPAPRGGLRAGELSVEQMTSFLVANPAASSTDDAFPLLRAAGEMAWVPHEPGPEELSAYESAVSEILAELPALFLCMYDLRRFGVGMLVDVLRIHSKVVLDGTVLDNPHCLAPTDYPKPAPAAVPHYPLARVRTGNGADQWLSLTGAEVRIADLVAKGMTNRATAEELVVSPHTVDAHLKHMYVKLGIHSRVELTVLALQHGPPAD